jgi:chloramphenicol 3-O phosphotransferase
VVANNYFEAVPMENEESDVSTISGDVIVLNGPSSAGKTSVAQALQEIMEVPYFRLGVDDLGTAGPPGLMRFADEGYAETPDYFLMVYRNLPGEGSAPGARIYSELRIGPNGMRVIAAMYSALAEIPRHGVNLIVDSVIFNEQVLREAVQAFRDLPVLFVGLHVPREVAERRERARGDRELGTAGAHYDRVHGHGLYDLEFDTSMVTPLECAQQIKRAVVEGHPRMAFGQLAAALQGRGDG